jgi:hypothetical protein
VPRHPSFILKIKIKQPYFTSLSSSLSDRSEREGEREREGDGERVACRKHRRAKVVFNNFGACH